MSFLRPLLFSVFLAVAPGLFAGSAYPQIENLRTEVTKYVAALKPEQKNRYGVDLDGALQAGITRVESELAVGSFDMAEQQLQQLTQMISTPVALKLINELLAVCATEKNKRNAELLARADELVARTGELCLTAKTEKELDQLQLDLAQARLDLGRNQSSEPLQRSATKIDAAANFARKWQDYLAQFNAGNLRAAAQIMNELANNNYSYPILPRSALLARAGIVHTETGSPAQAQAQVPQQPVTIQVDIKSLDDLSTSLERIQHETEGKILAPDSQDILAQLSNIQAGLNALNAGNIGFALQVVTGINGYPNPRQRNTVLFADLRRQLVLRVIPHLIDVSGDLAPRPEENPADYFVRAAKLAKEAHNWSLLAQIYDAFVQVCFTGSNPPEWLQSGRAACKAYLVGLGQEKAGNLNDAQNSFNAAISTGSQEVPLDDIAARLQNIRRIREEETEKQRKRQQQDADAAVRRQRELDQNR